MLDAVSYLPVVKSCEMLRLIVFSELFLDFEFDDDEVQDLTHAGSDGVRVCVEGLRIGCT